MDHVLIPVLVLAALSSCGVATRDNKGTEFILTFTENFQRNRHDPKLFISTPHQSGASVTVTLPSISWTSTVRVTYGQVAQVDLNRVAAELRGSQKSDKVIHVTSDVEIVVYGVFAETATSDAYLALPTDVLGMEYFVPCTTIVRGRNEEEGFVDLPAEFAVVGVHDMTNVTIVPSQAVTFEGRHYTPGQAFSVALNRLEALQVQATEDLTGSRITSTQPVAVLSGTLFAVCRPVGEAQTGSGDYVVEMVPPVDTWGTEFVTVPLTKRTGGDLFRVLAARDNTQVAVTNENTRTLNAGDFWELDVPSDEYRHVTSNEPVLLVQYSKTGHADGVRHTDPFMMVIPPVAQFEAEYTFATVRIRLLSDAVTHHVNLVISSADKAGLRLDGQQLPSNTVWHDVPGSDYSAAQLNITAGTHTVGHVSPIATIGLFSYGFARAESYGYPGGLRLSPIAAACRPTSPGPADRVDNDCDGRVDEELLNGMDDDGDGRIDEDLAISNCYDHRDRYKTCLQHHCGNHGP